MLRSLLIIVFAAASLWAGYWFYGSYSLRNELIEWTEDRLSDGWQVEYSDLSVNGFPNRFDTTITDFQIADPVTGISWTGPFLQAFQLSYQPQHIIFAWPDTHVFSTPYQKIELTTENAKASVVTKNGSRLTLERATFETDSTTARSSAGWNTTLSDLDLSIRQLDGVHRYEVASTTRSIKLSEGLVTKINKIASFPENLTNLQLRVKLVLSEPLDIKTIEVSRPQFEQIEIDTASANWGTSNIRMTGSISVDQAGAVSGDIIVNTNNWSEALDAAIHSETVSKELGGVLKTGLQLLATLSGSKDSLQAPLRFDRSKVFLGPIPIGQIPPLVVR